MESLTKEDEQESTIPESTESKCDLQEEDVSTNKPLENDAELDITSENFNPLKALYAPEYRVTKKEPNIIYQNMSAFEIALKKVGIMGLNKTSSPSNDGKPKKPFLVKEETTQRRFQDHQMAIKTERKVKNKHQRNLIMQMTQAEGPLKHLQLYIEDGAPIKVSVRKEHGIKGYVEGKLKMFDRHWNLLMVDVLECLEQRKYKYADDKLVIQQKPQDCSYILEQLGITLPQQSIKNLGRKKVEVRRHFPQLLLRGEHIVFISAKGTT